MATTPIFGPPAAVTRWVNTPHTLPLVSKTRGDAQPAWPNTTIDVFGNPNYTENWPIVGAPGEETFWGNYSIRRHKLPEDRATPAIYAHLAFKLINSNPTPHELDAIAIKVCHPDVDHELFVTDFQKPLGTLSRECSGQLACQGVDTPRLWQNVTVGLDARESFDYQVSFRMPPRTRSGFAITIFLEGYSLADAASLGGRK